MNQNTLQGIVCLILAQTMVATNIVVSKFLVAAIPVLPLLAIRFTLASLVLLPLHWCTPDRKQSLKMHFLKLERRDWFFLLSQALTAGFLFNSLMLVGLHYTDANIAGIITSALPAFIAILSWIVLGEKISAQKILCIFFATLGLIIIASDKLTGVSEAHSFFGDAIVLLSLLPEATYYVLCKLHNNRLPLFLISALMNGINAVLLIPAMIWTHWTPAHLSLLNLFILVITGLSSGLFYVFWFIGSQRVDAIMASLSTAIMPVMTVLIAWLVLQEQLTLIESIGMLLVILSIFMYARK